jgi:hypothetical protein
MDRADAIEWLTQWGIASRVHNICGWYSIGPLGRIEAENVHRVNIPQPNTESAVQGISGDDRPLYGPDPKQIDRYKVQAIDRVIDNVGMFERRIANELYIKIPVNPNNRRQKGESWVASKLGVSRKVVRTAHSKLILFIQNDLELTM